MKLSEAVKLLSEAGVESPEYDAKEIFMRIGKLSRTELISPDAASESDAVVSAILRRAQREPLQYIIGDVGFYREAYRVSPACLIPRQDTEILVDYAVKSIPDGEHFLDLCTGSGCIAISTLKNTIGTTAEAVDISRDALDIARDNAVLNGVSDRISFTLADVLSAPVGKEPFAILSNPPYVTETAYKNLQKEIYFEPKLALVGADDGLIFYKRILELYKDRIKPDGFFAFEIGFDQADSISEFAARLGLRVQIKKDLSSLDRVAIITR